VIVHQTLIGGGFGRRDATDFAVEAAQIANRVGAPVQVFWTREDDFKFDRYRPAAVHTVSASLGARGFPKAWLDRMSSISIAAFLEPSHQTAPQETEVGGARDVPYDIPEFRMEYTALKCAVPVGWWRSVEDSINAFAVECFVDELAAAAQKDPLQYRMGMLPGGRNIPGREGTVIETDRLRRVLMAVADLAAWTSKAAPGRGRGLACHCCRGSYIAIVVEVSLTAQNLPTVHRIWAAVDCGVAVNPLGLDAQICGGLQFGMSAALYEAVTLMNGGIEQNNFNDYRLLRMSESPVTHVQIIASDAAPSGAGEIAVPPVAPAIANAVFRLTGRRVRSLPIAQALLRTS
jgi:CO/xanthine dehydrogenase Mo-binding subunit